MISADSPDVWARQDEFRFDATDRRAAGRVQRDRAGLGPAAVAWPASWRERTSPGCARARAATATSTTASASITSSACIAPTSGRSTSRHAAVLRSGRAKPAQIALGETLVGIFAGAEHGAGGDRRRSRIDPAVRARVDGAPGSARAQSAALGAALGSRRPAADRSGGLPGAFGGDDRHPRHRAAGGDPEGETEEQRTAIVQSLLSAGSCLTLIPLQDVFGWTDRINTPAVVDEMNWTWRVPWPVDDWLDREEADGARRSS